jgi:putative sterol carrier protein
VSVKFLSTEWADAVKAQLNADDGFREASAGQRATIQQIITSGEGDTHYWIEIAEGAIDMGVGDADGPDATITQSYETAVKLATSELSVITAFMTGKVKVAGNMGLLMGLQGALSRLPAAMQAVETDY